MARKMNKEKVSVMIGLVIVMSMCVRSAVGSRDIIGINNEYDDYWYNRPPPPPYVMPPQYVMPPLSPEPTWAPDARECEHNITSHCFNEMYSNLVVDSDVAFTNMSEACCIKISNAGLDCYYTFLNVTKAETSNFGVWQYCDDVVDALQPAEAPSPDDDYYY